MVFRLPSPAAERSPLDSSLQKTSVNLNKIGIALDAIQKNYPRLKKLCHELGDEQIPERVTKWR
jgi:hypothetical protein